MSAAVNLRWDTNGVRSQERFAYFVEGICRAFTHLDPVLPDPDLPFFVRIDHREIGESAVTRLRSSRYIVRRRPAGIAQSTDHDLFLNFIVSGTIDSAQGQAAGVVSRGDIFILDNARPFELNLRSHQVFDTRVVRLRRSPRLEAHRHDLLEFGRKFADHRLMPLLRLNLAQLAGSTDSASDDEISYFGQTVSKLVDLILSGDDAEVLLSERAEAWTLILAEIARNMRDPYFTLEMLATNLGVSTRHIQKTFAAHDCTFSEYLRDLRLQLAARSLQDGGGGPSIEDIARSSGFKDLSTFYRSFKRKYGMKPGDLRY